LACADEPQAPLQVFFDTTLFLMTFRSYLIFLIAVVSSGILWKYWDSETVQSYLRPKPSTRPPNIKFDNGSVREFPVIPPNTKDTPPPLGSLRKCQKGGEISYTNSLCPPGTREVKISNGTVSVVEGEAPLPKGAKKPDGMPDKDEPSIRDKMIDKAINR
jgi:hypothetical protein